MEEHARYAAYLSALLGPSPEPERDVLARVVADPDHVMAEAVLVRWLERAATSAASAEEFHLWLEGQETTLAGFEFARRRAEEWAVFLRAREGLPLLDVAGMSDWLQRLLADENDTAEVLARLAADGRTRRVRTRAAQRLQNGRDRTP
jgi:hypothetical protein